MATQAPQAQHPLIQKFEPYFKPIEPYIHRAVDYAVPIAKQSYKTFTEVHLPKMKEHKVEVAAAGAWFLYTLYKNPGAAFSFAATAGFIYARLYGTPVPPAPQSDKAEVEKKKD